MRYPTRLLDEVATIIMGLSPKASEVSPKLTSGLPLLNGPTEFGPVCPTPRQWAKTWSREAASGDILFCVRGSTTGRTNVADQPYAIGRGVASIRGRTARDTQFIHYAISDGLPRLLALTAGSVFPNLSVGDIREFKLAWPDRGIRWAIAATLGALDDKIESNRRAISLASRLIDTTAEQASNDLSTTALSALVTTSKVGSNPAKLDIDAVDHYSLPAFDAAALPERVAPETIMSNKTLVPHRAILLSRLNPRIERFWWVTPENGVPALASTEFSTLVNETDTGLAAAWLALRSPGFREVLPMRVTGTSGSHQRVRPEDLLAIDVPDTRKLAKPLLEQTLSLLEYIEMARRQSASLAALRDSLLPELLSGRIRVPVECAV